MEKSTFHTRQKSQVNKTYTNTPASRTGHWNTCTNLYWIDDLIDNFKTLLRSTSFLFPFHFKDPYYSFILKIEERFIACLFSCWTDIFVMASFCIPRPSLRDLDVSGTFGRFLLLVLLPNYFQVLHLLSLPFALLDLFMSPSLSLHWFFFFLPRIPFPLSPCII